MFLGVTGYGEDLRFSSPHVARVARAEAAPHRAWWRLTSRPWSRLPDADCLDIRCGSTSSSGVLFPGALRCILCPSMHSQRRVLLFPASWIAMCSLGSASSRAWSQVDFGVLWRFMGHDQCPRSFFRALYSPRCFVLFFFFRRADVSPAHQDLDFSAFFDSYRVESVHAGVFFSSFPLPYDLCLFLPLSSLRLAAFFLPERNVRGRGVPPFLRHFYAGGCLPFPLARNVTIPVSARPCLIEMMRYGMYGHALPPFFLIVTAVLFSDRCSFFFPFVECLPARRFQDHPLGLWPKQPLQRNRFTSSPLVVTGAKFAFFRLIGGVELPLPSAG